jgi:hypothetical protein
MALKEGDRKTRGWKRVPNRREQRNPLGKKNQCAYCKEEGHWKNECPNKKKKEKERVTVAAVKSKEDCNLQTNAAWGNESD